MTAPCCPRSSGMHAKRGSADSARLTFAIDPARVNPSIFFTYSEGKSASPTIALISGKTFAAVFDFESGYCWCQLAVIVSMFACACRIETPGFNRAMHRKKSLSRCSVIGVEPSFDSRNLDNETRRHYADHLKRKTVESDSFSNNAAIAAKSPLPQFVAQNDDVIPRFVLVRQKNAADDGLNSKQWK